MLAFDVETAPPVEAPNASVLPLRDYVLVQRHRPTHSESGLIVLPRSFKAKGPRLKMSAQPDYWPATVLAVGPQVKDLSAGDKVFVWNFSHDSIDGATDATNAGLYAGYKLPGDRYLVRHASQQVNRPEAHDDIMCAVEGATW